MYSISSAFAAKLANDNRAYLIRLDFTFVDGHQMSVNNSGVWQGGLRFEEAVSGDSEFQIGSAIINKLNITLNNISDQYSSYVFEGATVIAYIGLELSNGTTEMVRRGTYIVDSVTGQNASLIKLECLDYMTKFDVPYSEVDTIYPATLGKIVRDICSECSVTLLTSSFDGSSYVVRTRPSSDGLTCRQVLAYAAQIACAFARMDDRGRLEFRWFRVGENIDPEHSFRSIYNIATSQYNVAITGVRVTEEFRETDTQKKQTELWGSEGYVLDISGNELIQSGAALTVAQMIGQKLVGVLSFKTVDATITSDPSVEAGDTAVIIDEKGNSAFFPITRVIFETDNSMSVSCSAKTPSRQASTVYDQLTRAIIKANNYTSERLSDYDRAVLELSQLMSETFGVFMTEVVQQDGSVIRIQHNKPRLEDSDIQWKMTAGALAVSDDYGQTWNAGIDAQGNAVVNVLNAIGVNADWIRAGSLSVSNHDSVVFQADLDTGSVYISGDYVYIGDKTATEALNDLAGALVITLSNEMQGIPVDSDGHYDTFPNVDTTIRVFYGSDDVTPAVVLTDNPLGVTGTLSYNSGTGTYVYHATSLTEDTGYVSFTATYSSQVGPLTNSKRFNLYKAYAGATGPAGTATLYMLEPNVDIVKRGADDICIPDRITFSAFYRDGDAVTRYPYSGLIEIYVMRTDSSEWELVVPALENKTSETYVITDNNVGNVKAVLRTHAEYNDVYWGLTDEVATDPPVVLVDSDDAWFNTDHTIEVISGGDTVDMCTIPILQDISGLTQDKVFDIITDGGSLEGLWYRGGQVYFNASYIGAGVIRSKNENTYWNLDTGNFSMASGSINLGAGNFVVTSGGALTAKNANIKGTIEATSLTLSGATIPYSKISDAPNLSVYVQKDGAIGNTPSDGVTGFKVTSAGLLSASNAIIYGTIYASGGVIGGCSIVNNTLQVANANITGTIPYSKISNQPNLSIYVQKDGTIGSTPASGATGFLVSSAGALRASNAIIYGTIYASAGEIGGCNIVNNTLQVRSVNITGTLTSKTIDGGKISGTKIFGAQIEGTSVGDSGDETYIRLKNGTMHIYNVASNWKYENQDGTDAEIISRLYHVAGITATKSNHYYDDLGGVSYFSDVQTALRNDEYTAGTYFPEFWTLTTYKDSILYNANVMHAFRIGSTKAAFFTSRDVVFNRPTTITQNTYVNGNLYVKGVRTSGTKSRTVQTEDYGKRLLYCYETPAPLFGDVGDGVINDDGLCYVQIDPAFLETIKTSQYQVFLQAYGDGKCYVKERKSSYFVVAGDPGLEFGWEMKARQIDFAQLRLERDDPDLEFDDTDYADEFSGHIKEVTINYGAIAEMHIEDVNKERARI